MGAVLVVSTTAVLFVIYLSQVFALPAVLFGDVTPRQAFRLSRRLTKGKIRHIAPALFGWLPARGIAGAVINAALFRLGDLLVAAAGICPPRRCTGYSRSGPNQAKPNGPS